MTIRRIAQDFIEACESGAGWDACHHWCTPQAEFASQLEDLCDINDLETYCDWIRTKRAAQPGGRFELQDLAVDKVSRTVIASAVFHGTQDEAKTRKDGAVDRDYSFVLQLTGNRISHMTKLWNNMQARVA